MFACVLCDKKYDAIGSLHSHIRKIHNLDQKQYYYMHFPRIDLGDGSLIKYKNYEHYFSSDFNNRMSLSYWAQEEKNFPEAREYVKKELKKRFEKGYKFYPSQSELKSLMLPSIYWIMKIFGNYETFLNETKGIGLVEKFVYNFDALVLKEGDLEIIVDSREQRPLFLRTECICSKLPVGDYCCSGEMYSGVYVERKSLADLAGTISSGYERFEKEIEKAKLLGLYIIVICEESHSNCLEYSPPMSLSRKVNGSHIFHQIRAICQKYDNIQFTFCSDRGRVKQVMEVIFRLGEKAKTLDIEFEKDSRKI
jgi:hypothetical protein